MPDIKEQINMINKLGLINIFRNLYLKMIDHLSFSHAHVTFTKSAKL